MVLQTDAGALTATDGEVCESHLPPPLFVTRKLIRTRREQEHGSQCVKTQANQII